MTVERSCLFCVHFEADYDASSCPTCGKESTFDIRCLANRFWESNPDSSEFYKAMLTARDCDLFEAVTPEVLEKRTR